MARPLRTNVIHVNAYHTTAYHVPKKHVLVVIKGKLTRSENLTKRTVTNARVEKMEFFPAQKKSVDADTMV